MNFLLVSIGFISFNFVYTLFFFFDLFIYLYCFFGGKGGHDNGTVSFLRNLLLLVILMRPMHSFDALPGVDLKIFCWALRGCQLLFLFMFGCLPILFLLND